MEARSLDGSYRNEKGQAVVLQSGALVDNNDYALGAVQSYSKTPLDQIVTGPKREAARGPENRWERFSLTCGGFRSHAIVIPDRRHHPHLVSSYCTKVFRVCTHSTPHATGPISRALRAPQALAKPHCISPRLPYLLYILLIPRSFILSINIISFLFNLHNHGSFIN